MEGRRPRTLPKKSRGIQRKREAKTMHLQKKNGTKKEDLKKKTLSRNRPPDSIQNRLASVVRPSQDIQWPTNQF